MITISLPDGARREYPDGATGATVAEGISRSLAKKAVAVKLNGQLADLADLVPDGASLEIVTRDDASALELIRHDCAHVLAEAVQELFPGTQVTIGPVIENGFYYDFFRDEPFSTEDFPAIEGKMREIIARGCPFRKEVWSRDRAVRCFGRRASSSRSSWSTPSPKTRTSRSTSRGTGSTSAAGRTCRRRGRSGTPSS
jgi:threonyl-tRNA synthetase